MRRMFHRKNGLKKSFGLCHFYVPFGEVSISLAVLQARDMMEWEYCRDLVGSLLNYLSGSQRLPSNAALDSAILEQGYCALGNVCATGKGQDIILNNPDAISLLKRGLQHGDTCVQSAAVFCICNLAKTQDDTPREDKIYLSKLVPLFTPVCLFLRLFGIGLKLSPIQRFCQVAYVFLSSSFLTEVTVD